MKKIITFVGVSLLLILGIYVYFIELGYFTPDETAIYYTQNENDYYIVSLCPGNELILSHSYADRDNSIYAAEQTIWSISGEQGRKLLGQFYILGESLFGIRKAPLDTCTVDLNMKCISYLNYNTIDASNEYEGAFMEQLVYISDNYFVMDDMILDRINSEEDLPFAARLPLSFLGAN